MQLIISISKTHARILSALLFILIVGISADYASSTGGLAQWHPLSEISADGGATSIDSTLNIPSKGNVTITGNLSITGGNVSIGTASPTTGKLVVSGGNVDVTGNKIINLAAPTASTDAATKGYVDAASGGGGCYTNYGGSTCAAGWTAVLTGYTTTYSTIMGGAGYGAQLACSSITHNISGPVPGYGIMGVNTYGRYGWINNEPCAICCK